MLDGTSHTGGQTHQSAICSLNCITTDICSVRRQACISANKIIFQNRTFHYMGMCTSMTHTINIATTSTITTPSPAFTTTTIYIASTCSPTSCDQAPQNTPATLHGVYMTVLLVLVAVTITMTTLVVYMCLMMRRAKSGRVPQTTTGTTYYNMAASDYCEPISLRHVQNTNGGV